MEEQERPKSPTETMVEMTELVLPGDANALGTAFGGKVMQWIDTAAAISAIRHTRKVVVTASMDELHFHAPIKVGEIVHIRAKVNAVFRRSLEVGVEVYSEEQLSGITKHTCSALLTFTALDGDGRPSTVPPLKLETQEERDMQAAGEARRNHRLANRRRSSS